MESLAIGPLFSLLYGGQQPDELLPPNGSIMVASSNHLGATFAWLGRLRTNNVVGPLPPLQLTVLGAPSVARKPPDSRLSGTNAAHNHWCVFLCVFLFGS